MKLKLLSAIGLMFCSFGKLSAQCNAPSAGNVTSCAGQQFTLQATTFFSGTIPNTFSHRWYNSQGNIESNITQGFVSGNVYVSSYTSTSSVDMIFNVASVCDWNESATKTTVKFTATPPSSIAINPSSSPTSVCSLNFSLTATGTSSFTWYLGDPDLPGYLSLGSATTIYPTSNGQYFLKGLPNTCSSGDQKISIPVTFTTPMNIPDITGSSSRCQGSGTTQFTSNPTNHDSYQWSILNAGSSTVNSSGVVTWDPAFYGPATVKISAFGCTGTQKQTIEKSYAVTVTPSVTPSLQLGGPTEVCPFSSAMFHVNAVTGTGSSTYVWKQGISTLSFDPIHPNDITINNWDYPNGTIISCTLTTSGCISGNSTVTASMTVNRKTQNPFSVNMNVLPFRAPSFEYCYGESITFQATASDEASFQWERNGNNVGSASSLTISNFLGGTSDVIKVKAFAQNQSGCYLNTYDEKLIPYPITVFGPVTPNAPITPSTGSRCQGSGTTSFSSGYTVYKNYQWSLVNGGNNTINNAGVLTWDPNYYGTVTVKVTAQGCNGSVYTSINQTADYSVSQSQSASIRIDGPASVCNGFQATFGATPTNPGTTPSYVWLRDDIAVLPNNSPDPRVLIIDQWNFPNGTKISCKLIPSIGCVTGGDPVASIVVNQKTKVPLTANLQLSPDRAPDFGYCNGEPITFTAVTNALATSYAWSRKYLGASTFSPINGSSNSITISDLQDGEVIAVSAWAQTNSELCLTTSDSQEASSAALPINIYDANEVPLPYANTPTRCQGPGTTNFHDHACYTAPHQWSISGAGSSTIDNTGKVTWDPNFSGTAMITVTMPAPSGYPTVEKQLPYVVKKAGIIMDQTLTKCNWEDITLIIGDESEQTSWYDNNNVLLGTGYRWHVGSIFNIGSYTYKAETISKEGCSSFSKSTIQITIVNACDDRLNWIETTSLNENNTPFSNSKSYFDFSGQQLQTQTKLFSPSGGVKVLASQNFRDRFGRVVGSTLSAPIPYSDFNFHYGFMLNENSLPYGQSDFDNPQTVYAPIQVSNSVPGTVGWYYSANNNLETNVPVTNYPYSRTEFYEDGTGEVRRSGSPGDMHRIGAGHEPLSGTFPVYTELDDYLIRRRTLVGLPDNQSDDTFKNEAVQSLVRDENGNYAISIADKSGKGVLTARQGSATDFVLQRTNVVNANLVTDSPDYRPLTYFYILNDQVITITGTGASYTIEDIVNGTPYTPGAGGNWQAGFYRIILTSGSISFSYTNYYQDVSCQFYDDAGRLKYSVSPNGYQKWLGTPATPSTPAIPPTPFSDIDKTTYEYNHQGWLLSMTEPDAGRSEYAYRKDGKIRFSQNAKQRSDSTFSYTNYDKLGRPIESGEYTLNGTEIFSALKTTVRLEAIDDSWMTWTGTKSDWVKSHYDLPDPTFTAPSGYAQQFVRSSVSWTENENIKTWYSYDDQGRVTWMAQKPTSVSRVFLVTYEYDFLGNVKKTGSLAYLSGQIKEQFYHHYEYDLDKRLSKAYTSLNGTDKKLRATYKYYLHGPLKRIELADKLQGIDFVYNINGWLTQINHPNVASDPGHDGASNGFREDAFGMTLDYYESTMTGLFPLSVDPMEINDPLRIHHLPKLEEPTIKESLAGTSGQQMKILLESMKRLRSGAGVGNNVSTEN